MFKIKNVEMSKAEILQVFMYDENDESSFHVRVYVGVPSITTAMRMLNSTNTAPASHATICPKIP